MCICRSNLFPNNINNIFHSFILLLLCLCVFISKGKTTTTKSWRVFYKICLLLTSAAYFWFISLMAHGANKQKMIWIWLNGLLKKQRISSNTYLCIRSLFFFFVISIFRRKKKWLWIDDNYDVGNDDDTILGNFNLHLRPFSILYININIDSWFIFPVQYSIWMN